MLAAPLLAFALVVAVPALILAGRSVVYPVALAGLPALAIGLTGSNPFPSGIVFMALTGWLLVGLAFALNERGAAEALATAAVPLVLTATLATVIVARLLPGPYPSTKAQLFVAQAPPLLVAGVLIARKASVFRLYLGLTLFIAVAEALLLLRQFGGGGGNEINPGRYTVSVDFNPILSGRNAALGIVLAMFLLLVPVSAAVRLYASVSLPLVAVALLAAGSRGPILSLVIGLGVLAILLPRGADRRKRLTLLFGSGLISIYLVSRFVPAEAIQRSFSFFLGTGSGRSSNQRTELWREAWQLFTEHPFLGSGVGGFALRDPIYVYPHNILLESLAELGIVGFALVGSFLALAVSCAISVWRSSAGVDREDAALVLALFTLAFVNAMLSDPIEAMATVWLTVGLVYGLRARARARAAATEPEPLSAVLSGRPSRGGAGLRST